ncbi:hypothetical protein MTR67_021000 [Solanum verrucosum]|uniref:F-box domain-containing protein n=1 Tax=Solanum verrucosum TaxID=315347 RepID=A0AAF0QV13_SOLVR|nr:hypothetical protein MTR67_021000 [Solanum verrucosum]
MDDYVANFPEDIVNEILLRCPVKSMLRFKCVCKNWYVLIKTPDFVQQHLKKNCRSPNHLIYDYDNGDDDDDYCGPMTLISEENSQTFLAVYSCRRDSWRVFKIEDFDKPPPFDKEVRRTYGMKYLIGYVDGLFLMYGNMNSVLSCALLNPATRVVRRFPDPLPMIDQYPYFGLGIDPLTNDFKVVNFFHFPCDLAAVYSCRRDSWRIFKIEDIHKPLSVVDVKRTYGNAYLNGNYYKRTYGNAYLNGNYYGLLTRNHISTFFYSTSGEKCLKRLKGQDGREYADGAIDYDVSCALSNPYNYGGETPPSPYPCSHNP